MCEDAIGYWALIKKLCLSKLTYVMLYVPVGHMQYISMGRRSILRQYSISCVTLSPGRHEVSTAFINDTNHD